MNTPSTQHGGRELLQLRGGGAVESGERIGEVLSSTTLFELPSSSFPTTCATVKACRKGTHHMLLEHGWMKCGRGDSSKSKAKRRPRAHQSLKLSFGPAH